MSILLIPRFSAKTLKTSVKPEHKNQSVGIKEWDSGAAFDSTQGHLTCSLPFFSVLEAILSQCVRRHEELRRFAVFPEAVLGH